MKFKHLREKTYRFDDTLCKSLWRFVHDNPEKKEMDVEAKLA